LKIIILKLFIYNIKHFLTHKKVNLIGGKLMPENIFSKEIKLKMGLFIAMVTALIISIGIIGFLVSRDESEIIVSKNVNTQTQNTGVSSSPLVTGTVKKDDIVEEIKVYVVGEVNKPGVVTLREGQIIEDAIRAAGGFTNKADIENINLAFELKENVMLKILPKAQGGALKGEVKKQQPNSVTALATPIQSKAPGFSGIEIKSDSGGAIQNENAKDEGSKGKVNINTASLEELDKLPGVGPSTASKIVSFREKSGNFKKIEDIMNVPGIGESKFSEMKEFISVN
jgi:competence protein ComEA